MGKAWLGVLLLAIGCGDSHSARGRAEGDGGEQSVEEACAEFAEVLCGQRWQCIPSAFEHGRGFGDAFGSEARCIERTVLACRGWQRLPGTRTTPASLTACARDIAELACESATQTLTRPAAACELAQGSLGEGEPCTIGLQCASGYCPPSPGSPAGRCAPAPPSWSAADVIGAPCEESSDCGVNLVCIEGACAAPALAGEPCGPGRLACAQYAELACNDAGTCAARETSEGECGLRFVNGSLQGPVACASGECVNKNDMGRGRCAPYAEDGAACQDYSGPRCLYPALCTEGRCRVPGL